MNLHIGKHFGEKEKNDLERLYKDIPNEAVKARIKSCGEWYIEYAILYKWIFYIFSVIGIILPLVVTMINALGCPEEIKTVTMICSVLISFCTSFLTFTKCREKWTLYRNTVEGMKRELMIYWGNEEEKTGIKNLIFNLEKYMEEEHHEWTSFVTEMEKGEDHDSVDKETQCGKEDDV